jgi:hypothetical protein
MGGLVGEETHRSPYPANAQLQHQRVFPLVGERSERK